jgi:hypothetical protein
VDGKATVVDTSAEKNLTSGMEASYRELETRAIEMLLSGDNATFEQLRLQWSFSTIQNREFTGVGFFTRFEVPQHIPRTSSASFEIGDVDAWISGIQIGLLLFVRGGATSWFEAYTYHEPWPDSPVIERLAYRSENGTNSDARDELSVARLLKTPAPPR